MIQKGLNQAVAERSDPSDFQVEAHTWGGLTLRHLEVNAAAGSAFLGPRTERFRLTFLFESVGGLAYCRARGEKSVDSSKVPHAITLKPAGMESWLCSDTGGRFRAATLSFDRSALASSAFGSFELDRLTTPRMMFSNQRMWSLGLELVNECSQPGLLTPLYRDSIVSMLLIELLRTGEGRKKTGRLTQAQLDRVLECIDHSPLERLSLSELAGVAGLSPSHFSQAFRQTTGMPPYRWQLSSRVQKAQTLLLEGKLNLAEVALATGFVDQSHFTRTFRRFTGVTPSVWLRAKQ